MRRIARVSFVSDKDTTLSVVVNGVWYAQSTLEKMTLFMVRSVWYL